MSSRRAQENQRRVSNADVRIANRKRLVRLLLQNKGITRQEAATALGLSPPTINLLLGQLEEEGFITKQSAQVSSGGRIPDLLSFAVEARHAFGCEITSRHLRILLVNLAGDICSEKYIRLPFENTPEYWLTARKHMDSMIAELQVNSSNIIGVGIAIPGVVHGDAKMVEFAPTLNLKAFDFTQLHDLLGYPVRMENEANAAGYAEIWRRPEIENAIYLNITKGVGGAIIAGRELLYGLHSRSGEFGHMNLVPNGAACACGKKGCFEAYCSTRVLTSLTDGELELFFKQLEHSPEAEKQWKEYLEYLSIGIGNICVAWDFPVIVGGDIRPYLEPEFEKLQLMVAEHIPFSVSASNPCMLSKSGKEAAALGAVIMLVERFVFSI